MRNLISIAVLSILTVISCAIAPPVHAKQIVPPDDGASALAIFNESNGNTAIAIDGYNSVVYGMYAATSGATQDELKKAITSPTTQESVLMTSELSKRDGYHNFVMALTDKKFSDSYKEYFEQIGNSGSIGEHIDFQATEQDLSKFFEEQYGLANAIPHLPERDNSVALVSVVSQKTEWGSGKRTSIHGCKTLFKKEGEERATFVDGWKGNAEVAEEKHNNTTIYHIKMADDVIMSVVFNDDLIDNKIGEWLYANANIDKLDF